MTGVIWFVIAWLVLRADYTALATVGVLVGVALLIAAASEAALASVMTTGWAVWHLLFAVVLVLGALWSFIRPIDTFFALASVLGLLLLLQGLFTLVRGIGLRSVSPYWWLDAVGGGLLTLLGLWVSSSDGEWNLNNRAAFILLWLGFMAIFRGVSAISLAFVMRSMASDEERPPPQDGMGAMPASPRGREVPIPRTPR